MKARIWPNAALVVVSTALALLLTELFLREQAPRDYYVWPPDLRNVFQPAPGLMPGISGESRFVINSAGIRGPEFSPNDRYRILAVGGSTTECLYLDESEAWPQVLSQGLNRGLADRPVWVGNVGKSGLASQHHVLHVEKLLDQYPRIDLVVLLVGVNDLQYGLQFGAARASGQAVQNQAFAIRPGAQVWDQSYVFYKRTEIWRTLRKVRDRLLDAPDLRELLVQDDGGDSYILARKQRRDARTLREDLPDLSGPLADYARNLATIITLARARGAQVVLMTQPSLWRADLPQRLAQLLWLGYDKRGQTYYSVSALARAMEIYNDKLLEACLQHGTYCLDLGRRLPRDDTVFYDDVHFNEAGSARVAETLERYLRNAGLEGLERVLSREP